MYSYNLTGYDPDNDPIYWNLVSGPVGMSLDANLGTLRWTPLAWQVGNQNVTVKLVDSNGASVSQSWTIAVHGADLPPLITSTPTLSASMNVQYSYAVQATSPTGAPLTYSVISGPGSFSSTMPNLFTWTPTTFGYPSTITVQVSDGVSTTTQTWQLSAGMFVNYPPVITSQPVTTAVVGSPYTYAVTSYDRDGDTQTWSLSTSYTGSGGPTINSSTGVVTWTSPVAGAYTFTVTDTDAGSLQSIQTS